MHLKTIQLQGHKCLILDEDEWTWTQDQSLLSFETEYTSINDTHFLQISHTESALKIYTFVNESFDLGKSVTTELIP